MSYALPTVVLGSRRIFIFNRLDVLGVGGFPFLDCLTINVLRKFHLPTPLGNMGAADSDFKTIRLSMSYEDDISRHFGRAVSVSGVTY